MELKGCGHDKKRGKEGFNRQFGFLSLLFFTIQEGNHQTSSEYNNQDIHRVLINTYPQITQINAD